MLPLNFLQILFLLGFSLPAQAAPRPAAQAPTEPAVFRISGMVVDAISGQPLARASVSMDVSPAAGSSALLESNRTAVTDTEGKFAFPGVPPGKYVLSARRRGYFPQMYQQHESFTTAIIVGPGLDTENLTFRLHPAASVSGDVRDEFDDPIRHAQVMLFRENLIGGTRRTSVIRQVTTDDLGHYRFGHLAPGTYFVSVSAQPWYAQHSPRVRPNQENLNSSGTISSFSPSAQQGQALDVVYPVLFFPDANDLASAAPLALRAGDAASADFRLHAIPALHLLVRTPVTDPSQPVNIRVTQSLADGREVGLPASIQQVAPGLIEVSGVPPGRLSLTQMTPNGNATTQRTQRVQVFTDAEVDATQSGSSMVVSGVVRMDDDSPVPQPTRVFLRNSATGQNATTDVSATGEFSFKSNPVEMGNYEIMVAAPALFIRSLSSSDVKTTGRSFQITNAKDVSITVNVSKGTGRITGLALKNNKPCSGAMIVLAPLDLRSNPALFRRDQSDSDGTFSLNAVVPGRYTLMAIEDGWDLEWANPDGLKKYLPGGESVEIVPNQKSEIKVNVQ